jgi:hypothetical protein
MANKLTIGGIFHDLKNGSDCVNHDMLLSKLKFYGAVCKFSTFITSCLKNRYQKMVVDNRKTHNSTSSGGGIVMHSVTILYKVQSLVQYFSFSISMDCQKYQLTKPKYSYVLMTLVQMHLILALKILTLI